jgi:hypothetical protein
VEVGGRDERDDSPAQLEIGEMGVGFVDRGFECIVMIVNTGTLEEIKVVRVWRLLYYLVRVLQRR